MIYIYSGNDTFESFLAANKKAKEIANQTEGTEIKKIDADELESPSVLLTEIEGIGMFSSSNIILAKRLLSNKRLVSWLTDNFEQLNKSELVIWHDGKADGKTKLVKMIKKQKSLFDFEEEKDRALVVWLEKLFRSKNLKISRRQSEFMVERIGGNKWVLINEFRKIQTFLQFKDEDSLTDEELNEVLGFDVKGDIWTFLDTLAQGKKEKALNELYKLMQFENNAQYLIAMIQREINLMLKVKSVEKNGDFKSLGIHPFVLRKTITKAEKYDWEELKSRLLRLLKLDSNIKTGIVNDKIGIMNYVADW